MLLIWIAAICFHSVLGFLLENDLEEDNFTNLAGVEKLNHNLHKLTLPERYDVRDRWHNCISLNKIYQQGKCDGSWAFASASAMGDRICIFTDAHINQLISPQDLLECCSSCVPKGKEFIGGCKGGSHISAFRFWKKYGVVTGNCKPVDKNTISKGEPIDKCRRKCSNSQSKKKYKKHKKMARKTRIQKKPGKNDLRNIMAEIILNGPMVARMDWYPYMKKVPRNSYLYLNARKKEKKSVQMVKLIGWDLFKKIPVWIIANSMGRKWCNYGFCYVRRGYNDFNIEFYPMVTGFPKDTIVPPFGSKQGRSTSGGVVANFAIVVFTLFCCLTTQ